MNSRHFPPIARRRAGEGPTRSGGGQGAESLASASHGAVRISLQVVLAATQDGPAAPSGAGVARPIACSLCRLGVDSAVQLDDQLSGNTSKIETQTANGSLPPDLRTRHGPPAGQAPRLRLRWGLAAPKPAPERAVAVLPAPASPDPFSGGREKGRKTLSSCRKFRDASNPWPAPGSPTPSSDLDNPATTSAQAGQGTVTASRPSAVRRPPAGTLPLRKADLRGAHECSAGHAAAWPVGPGPGRAPDAQQPAAPGMPPKKTPPPSRICQLTPPHHRVHSPPSRRPAPSPPSRADAAAEPSAPASR
jgi:hypothetical protein